jgi:hypothetical protein
VRTRITLALEEEDKELLKYQWERVQCRCVDSTRQLHISPP